ncbi:MAG: DUF192 domain-containing protein [Nitrospinota bacterium]
MKSLQQGAVNTSTGQRLADRAFRAETFSERMQGLLGRSSLPGGEALLLDPCKAIHTTGMRFPIDALFLDRGGRVVRVAEGIPPGRLMVGAWRSRRVLELPAGTIASTGTQVGDRILLPAAGEGGPSHIGHWAVNLLLALLFGILATANLSHFLSVPTFGGMAIFLVNGLVATLFILRRKANRVTRRASDWALTLSTLTIPWGLRAVETSVGPLSISGAFLQGAGLLVVLGSLLSLGRSFGLTPADRGLVEWGLYRCMRHPMYTGELVFFLGFVLQNPTAWNWIALSALYIGLPLRALAEERLLLSDERYQSYLKRVEWRYLPALL